MRVAGDALPGDCGVARHGGVNGAAARGERGRQDAALPARSAHAELLARVDLHADGAVARVAHYDPGTGCYLHDDAGLVDPRAAGRGWDVTERRPGDVVVTGRPRPTSQMWGLTLAHGLSRHVAVEIALAKYPEWDGPTITAEQMQARIDKASATASDRF